MDDSIIFDSVTHLTERQRGCAVLCASHGGIYAGYVAAKIGIRAIALCDAGIGRERAGVAGLELLEDLEVPAVAIAHTSARIGDGEDCMARGIISCANTPARALGLAPGATASAALARMSEIDPVAPPPPPPSRESRHVITYDGARVVLIDSAGLMTDEDTGEIVVTGSHGGLLGGRAEAAAKASAYAAVFNDAGGGADGAGISRLPSLEARGIAGACVSAFSARIGDARSTYEDGFVSALNETARGRGGEIGQSCRAFAAAMAAAREDERP
ncbi:MAG: hypothetical protein AAGC70_03750 [Pseudomonadota bacterium]